MKRRLYSFFVILLFVFGGSGQAVSALELTGDILRVIDLEGLTLGTSEMDGILGGLPRCCHDSNYDPIEDKCLNNKGQKYVEGINDCDIWVETVLRQAGIDISAQWGSAKDTRIKGHQKLLSMKLQNSAPLGWSIQIIDEAHIALIRINKDGSADVYHQGYNEKTDVTEPWEGSRGYHYKNYKSAFWGKDRSFWAF